MELVIADDTAEGAFGCFDGVMTKLHNLRAAEAGQMLVRNTWVLYLYTCIHIYLICLSV